LLSLNAVVHTQDTTISFGVNSHILGPNISAAKPDMSAHGTNCLVLAISILSIRQWAFSFHFCILYSFQNTKLEHSSGESTFQIKAGLLKGHCHELVDPRFFSSNNSPWALIHGLKLFCLWLRIRRDIRDNR
jgi:hypothetical protein